DKTNGRFNLAFGFRPVGAADAGHEAVVGGELEKLLVEMQFAALLVEQHGLHPVGEHAFGYTAEIAEAVHHRSQQVMDILALRELDVTHPRVTQSQREAVKPASAPVAEVAPVHLALPARSGLEAHKGAFAPFLPPRA